MSAGLALWMRILLHLSAHEARGEGYELPVELTQQGIAEALAVRQSDVSRALARMKQDGQVEERSALVGPSRRGRKQRLKAYLLTERGRHTSKELSARLASMEVRIPPRPGEAEGKSVRLGEVNALLGTGHSLLRLADMVSPDGTLILSPPAARAPPSQPSAPEPHFFGREEELRALREWLGSAGETAMAVIGIPGMGKTALALRLAAELGAQRAFYFQVRPYPSYGQFLTALRDFLVSSGRRRLAQLLQRSRSPSPDEVLGALSRDLEGLGALIILDDFQEATGQPELWTLAQELPRLLSSLATPSKLLLLSQISPGLSLMPRDGAEKPLRELRLNGLDEESSRRLASSSGVPESELDGVYRLTRGHPLSIKLLGGAGPVPLRRTDARRFIQEEVIGRLPAGERILLQTLSILRRPEGIDTVLALSDDPLAFDALSSLVSRGLVSLSSGMYSVHEMVREMAYERIPLQTRKELHRRAAAYYSGNGGAEAGPEAVYHYCRAGDHERAALLLLSLGGELISEGRLEECRALLDMVDAGEHGQQEGLSRLRESLLDEYGEWDAGHEYLFQMSILSRAAGCGIQAPGRLVRSEREWAAALEDHERGLGVLRRAGDKDGQCELLLSLGWIRMMRAELERAEEAYRTVLSMARRTHCKEAALKARIGLGHIAWLTHKRSEADASYRAALRAMAGRKNAGLRVACLNHLACLAEPRDERGLKRAVALLERALALCGAGGHRRERAYTLLHLGRLRLLRGERAEAGRLLESALAEFRGIGDTHGVVYAELALALRALDAGETAVAREWASAALQDAPSARLPGVRECAVKLIGLANRGAGVGGVARVTGEGECDGSGKGECPR
ncbi:MAG: AAA family ATPase [Thermoplasmata archaeon]